MQTQHLSPLHSPDPSPSSHSRWLILTHRVPSSHSSFIYGVKSTKIYCRPTCPARLARRANVEFFDTADQARCAGFRPCKRCKPDSTSFVGEREDIVARVIALLRIRKADPEMKLRLKDLAQEAGVTPSYLCRVFKKTMGITIGTYMAEFEKDASDAETGIPVAPVGSDGIDAGTELSMPATTGGRTLSTPVECSWEVSAEDVYDVDQISSFDLDEWLSSEAFVDQNFLDDSAQEWGLFDSVHSSH
ncbi:metal binding domain of Ada-domain-containing protein [Aspergillus bertholletiae]|uniref:Metal binding domain of Ada-domain-containing protein n=1 Tax=Aspergillus bertholletiae TaxID=1226010 RepID=A0A5N7ARG8_9EURO|nr:metal binding domain of Ada-domain-containing protein [Aspergillus bertholletiae]